ncbi:unnamed protein product [Phytophthora fragariaefolia]|uniref:Unnamed protein product n=1 Tax=Phytophthora fragariaefolia TaxID=1490495 RepID=A0A9W6TTX1_9STRA|nr:unnamed protein product [Phytophthora fragariaefolia]
MNHIVDASRNVLPVLGGAYASVSLWIAVDITLLPKCRLVNLSWMVGINVDPMLLDCIQNPAPNDSSSNCELQILWSWSNTTDSSIRSATSQLHQARYGVSPCPRSEKGGVTPGARTPCGEDCEPRSPLGFPSFISISTSKETPIFRCKLLVLSDMFAVYLQRIIRLTFVVIFMLALVPATSSAWSFSSLFSDDDDSGSGSGRTKGDKSNDSDVKMVQPLLKATDWFLTQEEITQSRGDVPRSDMSTYTQGNSVVTFTATKEVFDSAYKDLSTTKENDRVLLAAWNTDLIPLTPDVDPIGAKSNFDVVFGSIVRRGGDVKILGWAT